MHGFIAFGVMGVFGAIRVMAQDAAPCLAGCLQGTQGRFAEFGCAEPLQVGCLCPNENFRYSVRDCSTQTCPGVSEDQALESLFSGFCGEYPNPDASEAPSTTEASTTAAPASTTAAEPSTSLITSTEEAPATTTEAEVTTTSVSDTTEVAESTTESATTSSASSTQDVSTTTTSEPESSQPSESEDDDDSAGGGLSQGAAVGIGIGVAVIVIAVAIVAVVILLRRRRNQQPANQPAAISRPMPPSSGRPYPSVDHGAFIEKGRGGGESIELQTNRYEDMPPRQTPRVMV